MLTLASALSLDSSDWPEVPEQDPTKRNYKAGLNLSSITYFATKLETYFEKITVATLNWFVQKRFVQVIWLDFFSSWNLTLFFLIN